MQPLFLGSALLVNLIAATGVLAFYTAPNIEIVVRAKMMEVCQQMCNKTCEPLNYVSERGAGTDESGDSSCVKQCHLYSNLRAFTGLCVIVPAWMPVLSLPISRQSSLRKGCQTSQCPSELCQMYENIKYLSLLKTPYYNYIFLISLACRSAYEEHAAAQLSVCLASCDRVDTIYRKSEALGMHIPTAHIVAVYRSQGGGGPPSSSGGTSSGGGNRNSDLVLVRRAEFAEATDARNPDWMRLIGASTGRSSGFLQPGSSAGGYEENAPTTNVVVMSIWRLFDAIWVYVVFSCVVVLLMCYCMFSMFMMERKGKIRKLLPAAKVEAVA